MWVFLSHVVRLCGFHVPVLYNGIYAVFVFMMLSGFVITRMRMQRAEPYVPYLLRRAARIYPAYLIALAAGVAVSGITASVYALIPWETEDTARQAVAHAYEMDHFWSLMASHLTLAQGLFPWNGLEARSIAFVAPAWSLSLEWQFYLVAPFLLSLLVSERFRGIGWTGVLLTGALAPVTLGKLGYVVPSILPLTISYFGLGIVSALLFEPLRKVPKGYIGYAVFAVLCVAVSSGPVWPGALLPCVIWVIALLAALRPEGAFLKFVSSALTCAPAKFMGRISYSFYVFHAAVYLTVAWALLSAGVTSKHGLLAGLLGLALPLTILFAALSYRFVELPAMKWMKNRLK